MLLRNVLTLKISGPQAAPTCQQHRGSIFAAFGDSEFRQPAENDLMTNDFRFSDEEIVLVSKFFTGLVASVHQIDDLTIVHELLLADLSETETCANNSRLREEANRRLLPLKRR